MREEISYDFSFFLNRSKYLNIHFTRKCNMLIILHKISQNYNFETKFGYLRKINFKV